MCTAAGTKLFMTAKTAQVHKSFEKKSVGDKIAYFPVKTGPAETTVIADLMILRTEQGHFTVAFTPFCPLHATNVHAASQCKAWQGKLAMQRNAKMQRGQGREARTDKRAESNDAARTSRDKERNTF